MTAQETLQRVAAEWHPEPSTVRELITPAPSHGLAGIFDQPSPVREDGDPLPPMWHWLHFMRWPAESDLGPDGHPVRGPVMPEYPRRRRMFAGGRVTMHAPLRSGTEVTRVSRVADVQYKEGRSGPMLFVTAEYRFTAGDDLLCVEEQDIVYRQDPEEAAAPRDTPHPATAGRAEPESSWNWSLDPGPAMLFRFSALTFNPHRIHYDQPYVTGVEGFPGLVVHGPLTALALLELPRRAGLPIKSFTFRARRPMYTGEHIIYEGTREGDKLNLHAHTAAAPQALTAEVEL